MKLIYLKFQYKLIILLAVVFIAISGVSASGQVKVDSIFNRAIEQTKNQKLDSAIYEANKALTADKKRGDICVYLANLYSWKSDYVTAKSFLKQAQANNYVNDDYYLCLTNVLIRSASYEEFLADLGSFKKNYSDKNDLFKKELTAYEGLQRYDDAVELIRNPENKTFVSNSGVDNLYTDILLKRNKKMISAYYSLDFFDKVFTPQHLASLGYSFPVYDNSLGFRVNYANRFGLEDYQLETDFYLKLKKSQYLYLNYGYAFNATLFPQHRAGIEYYFPGAPKVEASIGGRFLKYSSTDVYIVTGHIGRYLGNSFLSLRPYFVLKNPYAEPSISLNANYRIFGKNELNYWGIELGYGNSPDDSYSASQSGQFSQLSNYRVRLEKNFMVGRTSDIHFVFGYSKEEYLPSLFRNRFTIDLGYKIRLR